MSDIEGASPLEDLHARHRKEKKELKEKCITMKKLAKCGNKQKQKETNAEIEELEKAIEIRHAKEIEELSDTLAKTSVSETSGAEDKSAKSSEEVSFYKVGNVSNKKQKMQAKKTEAADRLKAAIQEDREKSLTSLRFAENTALMQVLAERDLQLIDILPDGDCLYNSIAHQINKDSTPLVRGKDVRRLAASYILSHKDDFAPFLINDEGEPLEEFEYEQYCGKVEKEAKDGGDWGGEPEIIAISKSLERKIEVIQPEGRSITYGEEYPTTPLIIVYLRHAYNLGEHYNSTLPK